MPKVHVRYCKGGLMLESTRIDVYARRSASRCARESWSWNKPGRNSRSPDFVLEPSWKVSFRSFVTFHDSSLGYLLQASSNGTISWYSQAVRASIRGIYKVEHRKLSVLTDGVPPHLDVTYVKVD